MGAMKIPWAKPNIGEEELDEITDSFRKDWLTMGPKVSEFEKRMAEFVGAPYAVAVSNGTVALDIVWKTLGVGPGDEVIVPSMTYFATAASVSYQHAVPVFVDIERDSFNLDPERIPEAVTERTKAIVFIDYGGNPSDFDNIAKVGRDHHIPVVQDAAQSLGAVYRGRPMGAQTEISSISFHLAKVFTTVEGGMIFTHNEGFRDEVFSRRNQGEPKGGKYKHVVLGTNARMTDIQGGIGLAQFKKFPRLLAERRRVAATYDELFAERRSDVLGVSTKRENSRNGYFFYPILISDRDRVADALRNDHGIDTRIAYPMPVYRQAVYASGKCPCISKESPVAEEVTAKILNLPIFPDMTDEMVGTVVDAVCLESES